jgi:hypothetical protein
MSGCAGPAEETSDDERTAVDDELVPEVLRKPIRTAGGLSETGDASSGITLEELLGRVQRLETSPIGKPEEPDRLRPE